VEPRHADGRRGFLHHLAVAERCRGLGIGSELVRRCVDAVRAAGLERTHLFVHTDNDLGLRFWERAGCRRRDDIVMFTFVHDAEAPRP
jgi:N-acetylglutamate synthase